MNSLTNDKMHIVVQLPSGQGIEQGGWRWPNEDSTAFINDEVFIKAAQIAEKGKLDGLFLTDIPGISVDVSNQPPQSSLDPIVILTLMAKATQNLGLISTVSTSHNEPFTIARSLRSLDIISKGRIGWNVVTTGTPDAVLNFFEHLPSSEWKHERSIEVWEAVLQLWGSWQKDALILNKEKGIFADTSKINPIHYKGKYVATKGPINLPPSPQGMPVVFTAGGGHYGFDFAVTKADAMYNNPPTLEYAMQFWKQVSTSLRSVGRHPDEFTVFNGIGVSIASSEKEALERRAKLDQMGDFPARLQYLSYMLGVQLQGLDIDTKIPDEFMKIARPSFTDYRSKYAYDLAKKGFTIREVIAHGPINYHPIFLGTPESIADKFQHWFQSGVGKGFSVVPDSGLSSLTDFVEQVVPILQKRGLLREEYEGNTLREHLGIPYQNGIIK